MSIGGNARVRSYAIKIAAGSRVNISGTLFVLSTEHVVDRVRFDLFSMTKEVWEGEDTDIARDQLHELSFKEMPETYDQIDNCNNVIKKAQKEANESKNFCNDFPQIFRSGFIPSESDKFIESAYNKAAGNI